MDSVSGCASGCLAHSSHSEVAPHAGVGDCGLSNAALAPQQFAGMIGAHTCLCELGIVPEDPLLGRAVLAVVGTAEGNRQGL